jgi:hypothetical protein
VWQLVCCCAIVDAELVLDLMDAVKQYAYQHKHSSKQHRAVSSILAIACRKLLHQHGYAWTMHSC